MAAILAARHIKPTTPRTRKGVRKISEQISSRNIRETGTQDTRKNRNGGNDMENHKPTQNQRVLDYIREFGSITQL